MSNQEPTPAQVAAAESLAAGVERDLGLPPGSAHANPLEFNPDGKKPQDNIPLEDVNISNGDTPVKMGVDTGPGNSMTATGMVTISSDPSKNSADGVVGSDAVAIIPPSQLTTQTYSSKPVEQLQQTASTESAQQDVPEHVELTLRERVAQSMVAIAWKGMVVPYEQSLALADALLKEYTITPNA